MYRFHIGAIMSFRLMLIVSLAVPLSAHARQPGAPPADAVTLRARFSELVGRPGGLNADDVAARAVATSFDLRQRKEELLAAAAAVDQALVAWFPRLGLSARYTRLSSITNSPVGNLVVAVTPTGGLAPTGPIMPGTPLINEPVVFPVYLNQTSFVASLQVPLLDYVLRIPSVNEAAHGQREAARWSLTASRRQVAADAREAYYAWARARLQVVVAQQALLQTRAHLSSAQSIFDAGSGNKADVMRVQAQVAASELFLQRARDLELVTAEQLRAAMHDGPDRRYEIGEDLNMALHPMPLPESETPGLVEEAWHGRAEVRILNATKKAQDANEHVAFAGVLPRLDLYGDVTSADPNPRYFPQRDQFDTTWDVGAQLTVSPNDIASAAFQARGAAARARAIMAQTLAFKDRLRVEVTQAAAQVREADFAVQSTAHGLEAAEESYRVRRDLFANARATSIELTDAETDLTQARLNAVSARIDQRVARVRLNHALGRDSEVAHHEERP
jgi:outer membrane protein TolC